MNRSDFYSDMRKERKVNFLKDLRVVRKYFTVKHDIGSADLEVMFKLHDLGDFIQKDFDHATGTAHWFSGRFKKLQDNDWIKLHRKRKPSAGARYNIYRLTLKAKRIINDFYKTLCGEIEIPTNPRANPLMKRESYTDKVYATAIERFNAEMRALREN